MLCLLRTITQPAFFQSLICHWRPAPTHAPTIMITLRRNETHRYTAKSAPGILSGWEVPVYCFTGSSEERPHVFLHVFQTYWVSDNTHILSCMYLKYIEYLALSKNICCLLSGAEVQILLPTASCLLELPRKTSQ